jgi:hypothetical protein
MIRRNPWMALLWVIGCVLVLGTAGMQTWTAWFYFQTDLAVVGDPVLTTLAQIAGALALPAALVGIATVAGLLFLHAKRRARPTARPAKQAPSR